ncbi:unnamed protein product [Rhizophagus irregularis]|nr:unnamed protein product [Rhizophagus irregularis]
MKQRHSKVWRIKLHKLETLRSIVLQSNKFLVYEADWNIMKIKYIVGLKLLNLWEVFLRNLTIHRRSA